MSNRQVRCGLRHWLAGDGEHASRLDAVVMRGVVEAALDQVPDVPAVEVEQPEGAAGEIVAGMVAMDRQQPEPLDGQLSFEP
jgi:hypothetical protein